MCEVPCFSNEEIKSSILGPVSADAMLPAEDRCIITSVTTHLELEAALDFRRPTAL